jgi:hypothetical protein
MGTDPDISHFGQIFFHDMFLDVRFQAAMLWMLLCWVRKN